MGTLLFEIDAAQRVNVDQLIAELVADPKVEGAKLLDIARTETINGEVIQKNWKIEIEGEADLPTVEAIAAAHNPAKSSEEQRAEARAAKLLSDFAPVIAEIKRQVLEEINSGK